MRGVPAQRPCSVGTTSGRVLCEGLRNVHVGRLFFVLSVFLLNMRSGREGVVGVCQAGLEPSR